MLILFLKTLSIIVALIVLLRLKLDLWIAVCLLCAYTVIIFQVNLGIAIDAALQALVAPSTLELFVITGMVLYIAAVQKAQNMLDRLISSLNSIIRDKRVVAMIAPAVIGFLPMPGGALVSAPLVEVSTRNMKLKPEFNTFLNYWFRHLWEFIWPIYAGLLIFQKLSGIPLKKIILYQFPFTVLNIIVGLVIVSLYFKKHRIVREIPPARSCLSHTLMDFFEGIWPLLVIILLFFILAVPLYISITVSALCLTLVKRLGIKDIVSHLFSRSIIKTLVLIASVMIFQRIIQASKAFDSLNGLDISLGMVVLACFLVSFSMGFLTGVNTAFMVIAYPILVPLFHNVPGVNPFYISLYIYVIGFAGILASPLHLCLVLTNEYFKSSLYKVYRYLAPPIAIQAAVATALVFLLH